MRPETKCIFSYSFFAFIILTLLHTPAGFNVPNSDQLEQMPVLLRSIDADFLKNDWFTNKASEGTIRLGYLIIAYPFLKIMNYKVMLILFNLLTDFLTVVFSVALFRRLTKEKLPLLIFVGLLILGVSFLSFTSVLTLFFIPRKLAFLLILIGLTLTEYEKRGEFFCFLFAALLHPHVSVILIGSIYLAHILLKPHITTIGTTIVKSLIFAIAIFAFYSNYFLLQFKQGHLAQAAYEVAAQVRAPALFHFLDAGFLMQARFLGLLITSVVLFFPKLYRQKNWRFLATINLILICLTLIHYFFTDIITIPSISMQLLNRATDISFFITSFFVANTLARFLAKNPGFAPLLIALTGFTPFFIILVPFLIPAILVFQWKKLSFPKKKTHILFGLAGLIILEILFAVIFSTPLSSLLLSAAMVLLAITYTFAGTAQEFFIQKHVFSVAIFIFVLIAIPVSIDKIGQIKQENAVAEKLKSLTPQNAVLLVDPSSYLGNRARLLAERAVVVDMKAIPTNYEGIIEWGARIDDLKKVYPELHSNDELKEILTKYNVDYLVYDKELQLPFLKEIEKFDDQRLYKVELH